ncbi:putative P protein [Trifolium pratense virus A]|uniref:Putative P protein n=1 Tax=Trifolium pratense virus A TaxID=2448906 RepID=A0A510C2D6_9RHAB|nr:putative P protein [Trifolium pratense virus A]AYH53275.1 putative P protein [Trifolium pratense virus A]
MSVSDHDSEMDFESLGEPIVGFALPNPMDPDKVDMVSHEEPTQDISTAKKDVVEVHAEKLSKDAKLALESLSKVCSALGVNKTIQMENQIKTMSKTESIKEEHIIWYVRGISLANNTSVLSAITDSISDLKSESRHLSNVTNKTSKVAASVDKVSVGLRSLLDDITTRVRESFDKTVTALADSYEEKIKMISESSKIPADVVTVPVPEKPIANVTIENKSPTTEDTGMTAEKHFYQDMNKPVVTTASDENIQKDKRALMLRVGMSVAITRELKDAALSAVLPDDTYAQIKTMVMTPKVCAGIKQLLMKNLNQYIEKMTPSSSGTK